MSEHGTYLDCGCYIAPGGGRSWCPTCAGGGHKDTRDDTIRSLRLEVGRMLEALGKLYERAIDADDKDIIDAALSTPGDGLWEEVRWLLENPPPNAMEGDSMATEMWYRRRDMLLGRKP